MIYVIRHSLLYFPLQSRVSPRVSPEVMTVFLSTCALITVLETLTENDLKWLIKSQKYWRRIKTRFLLLWLSSSCVSSNYKYIPSCSLASQWFSSLMPVYHILIVGNSNIFSASPTIGTITSYDIKISERRLF